VSGTPEEDGWQLASIVESSEDAIVGKTLDGVVTSWNGAAARIFGYAPDEMIGRPISILFPPELESEEADILARLRGGERIRHYVTERLHKDGHRISVSLSVAPILDGAGRVVGACKIARDITEDRRLQARLQELREELLHVARQSDMGQMAQAFAHELNQPLAALANYVSGVRALLERGDTVRAAAGCELAQRQVARAGDVVRRLRDFVKKAEVTHEDADLPAVIRDSLALAGLSARGMDLKTELNLAEDASRAVMDRIQVQQVLVNLLRNAIEAMAESPSPAITVSTRRADADFVEVGVADVGPGLAENIRTRLFQPFNSSKAGGLGVGLSLCRTVIEDHGGRIWAEDRRPRGAVFCFTLPAA
jgi:two-component system sensor kinase FixL